MGSDFCPFSASKALSGFGLVRNHINVPHSRVLVEVKGGFFADFCCVLCTHSCSNHEPEEASDDDFLVIFTAHHAIFESLDCLLAERY